MLFFALAAVSGGILVVASATLHRSAADHRVSMIRDEEAHAVTMRRDAMIGLIRASVADLLFLASMNELPPFLVSHESANRIAISTELLAFARRGTIYRRIRILSPTGMEIVRIDNASGGPVAAGLEDLQYEGDRASIRALMGCAPGTVQISAADSDPGQGLAFSPALLHLGVAVGAAGETRGFLDLSLDRFLVLAAFEEAHPEPEAAAMLIDEHGVDLRPASTRIQPSFMALSHNGERFYERFAEEWAMILSQPAGQFVTENGLFTYDTLVPRAAVRAPLCTQPQSGSDEGFYWKNVSWVPAEVLAQARRAGAVQLAGWDIVGIFVLAAGSWTFSRWMTRRSDQHRQTSEQRAFLESTLQKYMSPEVYHRLVGDPGRHAKLGGEAHHVAVLFADIRGFTRFVEDHDPEYVVSVLNRTLGELTAPLRTYRGILDKFIGDGFLAFFEPESSLADAAERAVDAAKTMQRLFRTLWADASDEALRELGLGIGIDAGRVVVGNVGSESAMDYTVVGDAVNVASRLQSRAGSGDILVSDSVHRLIRDEDPGGITERIRLRGRREPMTILTIRTGNSVSPVDEDAAAADGHPTEPGRPHALEPPAE